MSSIIIAVFAVFFVIVGGAAPIEAQELPETFITIGDRLKGNQAVPSAGDFSQDADGLYINRVPACTVLGHRISPCE